MAEEPGQGGEMQGSGENREESKLELPSLRLFGRRKDKSGREDTPPDEEPTDLVEQPPPPAPAPSQERARRLPPSPPPTRAETDRSDLAEPAPEPAEPPLEPTPQPPPEPTLATQEATEEPAVQAPSARDDAGRSLLESLRREPDEPVESAPRRRRTRRERTGKERAPRQPRSLPRLNPYAVAILTGVVVGVVGVALTLGTGRGCEAVRGVGSCGGFGLFAMLVILAIQVILGAALLRAFRLTDPSSTSFLGVGLAAVIVLLFFLSVLDSLWMFLVIPALTAATTAFSWWLTSNFVERPEDDLTGSNLD